MSTYTINRVLQTLPVLLLTSIVVFLLLRAVPGDPATMIAGTDATPDVIAAVRKDLGLDDSLVVQYFIWIRNVLQGDLGKSFTSKLPVWDLVTQRLPATLELALAGMTVALLIALPLGITAAVKQRTKVDVVISAFTAIGLGIPNFWIGILLILLFSLALGLLPPGERVDFSRDPWLAFKHLLMPALTLGVPQSAIFARFLKASIVDAMHEDYVRTARAKGLAERLVMFRHVIRNALVPFITVFGIHFGRVLGGAVIIESVFAWPGVGRLMLKGIGDRDYMVVQGGLLFLVTTFVLINLIVDLSYGALDPRIRLGRRGR
jgi:ABC-type dipeptide/oligopeptide/nickel transport system permease component